MTNLAAAQSPDSYPLWYKCWHWFLDALFPRRCLNCGRWGNWCCAVCLASLTFRRQLTCPQCDTVTPLGEFCNECKAGQALDGLWPAQSYGNPLIRHMIKAIKFDGLTELIPIQVNLLNGLLKTFNLPPAWHGTPREKWLLTAVPLFAKRQRQRNFNQAELLAINLAKATGLNYLPTLLRTGKRRAQSELKDKQTRHANVQGVFSALPQANIAGQTFILVDDVYTSGATMQECAKVLKAAGAQAVWGLTVAKG